MTEEKGYVVVHHNYQQMNLLHLRQMSEENLNLVENDEKVIF